jgi:hypothetical protein
MEAQLVSHDKEVDRPFDALVVEEVPEIGTDLDESTPIARRLDNENKSAVSFFDINLVGVLSNAESTGVMRAVGSNKPHISIFKSKLEDLMAKYAFAQTRLFIQRR